MWVSRWCRRGVLEPVIEALLARFRRLKMAMAAMGIDDWRGSVIHWFGAMSPAERDEVVAIGSEQTELHCDAVQFPAARGHSALRRVLVFDQASWLPDNLRERDDSMTMVASCKARIPFLDQERVALVSSYPVDMRFHGRSTKRLLSEWMRGGLRDLIFWGRKLGLRVPVSHWFRGFIRSYVMDRLGGVGCRTRGCYRQGTLGRALEEHISGRRNHDTLIWALLSLEILHRAHRL